MIDNNLIAVIAEGNLKIDQQEAGCESVASLVGQIFLLISFGLLF